MDGTDLRASCLRGTTEQACTATSYTVAHDVMSVTNSVRVEALPQFKEVHSPDISHIKVKMMYEKLTTPDHCLPFVHSFRLSAHS